MIGSELTRTAIDRTEIKNIWIKNGFRDRKRKKKRKTEHRMWTEFDWWGRWGGRREHTSCGQSHPLNSAVNVDYVKNCCNPILWTSARIYKNFKWLATVTSKPSGKTEFCRNIGRFVFTWLVLLELREWPCSLPVVVWSDCACTCCCCPLPEFGWWFSVFAVSVSSVEHEVESEFSDVPESVTMGDANDDGSNSLVCRSFFFFGSDPKPPGPESSRAAPVRVVGGRPINGLTTDATPLPIPPILSWDVIFLLFKPDWGLRNGWDKQTTAVNKLVQKYIGVADIMIYLHFEN